MTHAGPTEIFKGTQEKEILEPKKAAMKDASGAELEASVGMTAILENQKQGDSVGLHCEAENSSAQVGEGSKEFFADRITP